MPSRRGDPTGSLLGRRSQPCRPDRPGHLGLGRRGARPIPRRGRPG